MVFPVALPDELQRGQVLLRALREEDWRLEYDLSRVPDVPQWTYLPPDLDEARARRVMERIKEGHQQRIAGRYAVVVNDEVLGTAGMAWREGPEPAVFYALKKKVEEVVQRKKAASEKPVTKSAQQEAAAATRRAAEAADRSRGRSR